MFILRPRRIEACLIALLASCASTEMRLAPRPDAEPVNQLDISGNACGPAALLASSRCGSVAWQTAAGSLPGSGDREKLRYWIRRHGLRPSTTLKGRMRWTSGGINVEDLTAAANEMNQPLYLPPLGHDDLFRRDGEGGAAQLNRARSRLERSLAKGIPPLLSLRRFALRDGTWIPIQGHFVTVTGVPRGIPRGENSFAIRYLDPLGGKACEGVIRIPGSSLLARPGQGSPCLEAVVPASGFGKKTVRRGDESAVVAAAVIGRW